MLHLWGGLNCSKSRKGGGESARQKVPVMWRPLRWPHLGQFSLVQSLSHFRLFATPWNTAHQASLSITNSQGLLKPMSIKLLMPSNHLILCHPLLLLPPIPPSIRAFSSESTLHMRWPKYWSFSFSISPSSEHPGPISFRMDWLDLLAVWVTRMQMWANLFAVGVDRNKTDKQPNAVLLELWRQLRPEKQFTKCGTCPCKRHGRYS